MSAPRVRPGGCRPARIGRAKPGPGSVPLEPDRPQALKIEGLEGCHRAGTAGLGWRPSTQFSDLFGIGVGWAAPASDVLDDQYTAEAFYRYDITPNLAITPDVQYIADPTLNPAVDSLWVASLRMRITF